MVLGSTFRLDYFFLFLNCDYEIRMREIVKDPFKTPLNLFNHGEKKLICYLQTMAEQFSMIYWIEKKNCTVFTNDTFFNHKSTLL